MKIKEQEPTGFETLWKLWLPHARKTDGRGKARPTYIKWLEAGADPQDIIDGARWFLLTMLDKDRPYINLLSVYINSERWVDECEKWRAHEKRIAERQSNVVQMAAPVSRSKFSLEWDRRQAAKQAAE
jgi:hypothetical protein